MQRQTFDGGGDPALGRLSAHLCAALLAHLTTHAPPQVPEAGGLLWRAFAELCEGRRYADGMPLALSVGELVAWVQLTGIPLRAHHLRIIRAMDRVWLDHARAGAGGAKAAAVPLTAEIFDAVFG